MRKRFACGVVVALAACGEVKQLPVDASADAAVVSITVTVSGAATGTVMSMPAGIDCPTNCTATFPAGTEVILTAAPASGAAFAGYSGACAGLDRACMVTADTNKDVTAAFATSGSKRFAKQIEGIMDAIAIDSAGNVLVAGSAPGTSTALYISLRSATDGSVIWEKTHPGLTNPSVAYTPSGEIALVSELVGTPTFGGRTLTPMPGGGTDFVVAKLSATGEVIWAKEFGGVQQDSPHGICVAPNGTIYIVGYFFSPSFVVGSTTLTNTTTTVPYSSDAFAAAFNADGTVGWVRQYGIANSGEDIKQCAVDPQNNPVVVGNFSGSVNWSGSGSTYYYSSTDASADGVILRLRASDGLTLYGRKLGAAGADIPYWITLATDGGWLMGGWMTSSQSFGGPTVTAGGATDPYVARYSSGGAYVWAWGGGLTGSEWVTRVALDSTGAAYATGLYGAATNLGGHALPNAGSNDVFLIKVVDGVVQWAKRFGGGGNDYGYGVEVDAWNTLFVMGRFAGTADVADESFTTTATYATFLVGYWP